MRGAFVWIGVAVLVLVCVLFLSGGNGIDRDAILRRARAAKKRYAKTRNTETSVTDE